MPNGVEWLTESNSKTQAFSLFPNPTHSNVNNVVTGLTSGWCAELRRYCIHVVSQCCHDLVLVRLAVNYTLPAILDSSAQNYNQSYVAINNCRDWLQLIHCWQCIHWEITDIQLKVLDSVSEPHQFLFSRHTGAIRRLLMFYLILDNYYKLWPSATFFSVFGRL